MSRKGLAGLLLAVLAGAGAAGWYVWVRPHDRLALARSLMAHGDARGAQLALRSVIQEQPHEAEALFRLGEVRLRLGDPIAAERELNEARRYGWDPRALAAPWSETLLAQGRFAELLRGPPTTGLVPDQAARVLIARSAAALALHQADVARGAAVQAELLAPHLSGAATASAMAAHAAGDSAAAMAAIRRALAIEPKAPAALLVLADLQRAGGDAVGALASLDAAVAAAPDLAGARLARAWLLVGSHQDARAKADLAALLRANPRNPVANYLQAELLARAQDFRGADAALQAAGPELDRLPRGELLLAVVKAHLNQPEQAADAAARYLAQAPGDPAAVRLVADLALAGHRPADAADALDRAVAAGHEDAQTYDLLGRADLQAGRGAAALQALRAAAALAPGDPAILSHLASLLLRTGHTAQASDEFQRLLALPPASTAPGTAAPGSPPHAEFAGQLVVAALQAGEPDLAAAALAKLKALPEVPSHLDSLVGLVATAQLDFPAAQAAFERAVRSDPQDASAKVNLAGVLVLRGQPAAAAAALRTVLARDPANRSAVIALQRLLLAAGRNGEAVAVLTAAHSSAAGDARVTATLADLLVRTGQAQTAISVLDAPAPTPVQPGAQAALLAARFRAQQALGLHGQAIDSLRGILAIQPRDVAARRGLVDLLLAGDDVVEAGAVAREGLAGQPEESGLLQADLAVARAKAGLPGALARADALAADPAHLPAARALRGEIYMAAGQYAQASAAFEAALRQDGASAGLALEAALAARAAGQPDRATGVLRDWLDRHPEDAEVAFALAVQQIAAGQLDQAAGLLRSVLARQPDNAAVLNNLAVVLQRQHDPAQARVMAQRAWLLSSTPQAADTLGWILLDADPTTPPATGHEAALDLLRLAAHALPSDPSVQYHYAAALKTAGQRAEAAAILTRLVATAAAFAEQAQARKLLDALAHG